MDNKSLINEIKIISGNQAKKFLLYGKDLLPPLIRDKAAGQRISKLCELLYVIIRVLNTDSKIDVKLYKHICHVVGILVVHNYPWARMNDTLHSVIHCYFRYKPI